MVVAYVVPFLPFIPSAAPAAAGTIIAYGENGLVYLIPVAGSHQVASLTLAGRVRDAGARQALEPTIAELSVDDASWDPATNLFVADSSIGSHPNDPHPRADTAISYYRADGVQKQIRFVSTTQQWSEVSPSPTGNLIAVTVVTLGDPSGTEHVAVIDDQGNARQLPSSSGPIAWSSDSKTMAYLCYPDHGSPQPCVSVAGTQRILAPAGLEGTQAVSVSPSGKTVAFTASNGQPETDVVATIDVASGAVTVLNDDLTDKLEVAYDPTGNWLAYIAGGQLRIVNLATGVTTTTMTGLSVKAISWTSDPLSEFGLS